MLALMKHLGQTGKWLCPSKTHPLKVAVDHSLAVDVDQPLRDAYQLEKLSVVNRPEAKAVRILS